MIVNEWTAPSQVKGTNSLAIAALVCGLIQFAGVFPAGIVAIVLGHRAMRQIRQSGDGGYGMAKAGVILGYIGIALILFGILIALAASPAPAGPAG